MLQLLTILLVVGGPHSGTEAAAQRVRKAPIADAALGPEDLAKVIDVREYVRGGVSDEADGLNAAIAAASSSGKPLYIPRFLTVSVGTRVPLRSNLTIYGGGAIRALSIAPSVAGTIEGLFYGAGLSNVVLDGITIDASAGVKAHPLLAAVYLTGSNDVSVKNCRVRCSYSGIYVRAGSERVSITDNSIDNSYGSAADASVKHGPSIIVGASDSTIARNEVRGIVSSAVADSSIATGIYAGTDVGNAYSNITITSNSVTNTYTGIALSYVKGASVVGNSVAGARTKNHSQGVMLTSCEGVVIEGNALRNVDYTAIALVDSKGCTVNANAITNDATFAIGAATNTANGITVAQTAAGGASENVVSNNSITVGGIASRADYHAIVLYGDRSAAASNIVRASVGAETHTYGITATGKRLKVTHNVLEVNYIGLYVIDVPGWSASTESDYAENTVAAGSDRKAIFDASTTGLNRYSGNRVVSGIIAAGRHMVVDAVPNIDGGVPETGTRDQK
jgi:parallel beta-helix repeat protein